jgi:hypothetical protein
MYGRKKRTKSGQIGLQNGLSTEEGMIAEIILSNIMKVVELIRATYLIM